MEGIKYVNLIKISQVVIEIQGVENRELAVPVNNTLSVSHGFLGRHTTMCLDREATIVMVCDINSMI